jgi:hypothetical protein
MSIHGTWCSGAVLAAAMAAGSAFATTITFDLGNGGGYQWYNSFTVSSGGYTLTFTNPLGSPHQQTATFSNGQTQTQTSIPNNQLAFERDSDGLTIGGYWVATQQSTGERVAYPGYTNGFTMSLSGPTDLVLKGYEVGYVSSSAPITTPFSLSQGATTLSSGNSISSAGQYNISGGSVFMANGASLQFETPWTSDNGLSQIRFLTFEVSSVPGAGLAGVSMLGLAGVSRRRHR